MDRENKKQLVQAISNVVVGAVAVGGFIYRQDVALDEQLHSCILW